MKIYAHSALAGLALLASCVSSGPEETPLAGPEATEFAKRHRSAGQPVQTYQDVYEKDVSPKAEAVYAEPISPRTLETFPHLRSLSGHLLLGGRDLQLVLAGVPAQTPKQARQPAVLAAFEYRRGQWRRSGVLTGIELEKTWADGRFLRPLGIDLGVETGRAYASVVYAPRGRKAPKSVVSYELDPSSGVLDLTIETLTRSERGSRWDLRVGYRHGQTLLSPEITVGERRGHLTLTRYHRDEVMTLVGDHLFAVEKFSRESGIKTLEESAGQNYDLHYRIYLTRRSAFRSLGRTAAVRRCLERTQAPTVMGRETCLSEIETYDAQVHLPPQDEGGAKLSHPIYVLGPQEQPFLYSAIFGGETLSIPLPDGERYRISATRSGGNVRTSFSLTGAPYREQKLELVARRAGRLRIAPGPWERPGLLILDRIDAPPGQTTALGIRPEVDVKKMGGNVFLVRDWPVTLKLLSGEYQVRLFRGGGGFYCRLRTGVKAGETSREECPARASDSKRAAAVQRERPQMLLSTPSGPRTLPVVKDVLGIDWLAWSLDAVAGKRGPVYPKKGPFLAVKRFGSVAQTAPLYGYAVSPKPLLRGNSHGESQTDRKSSTRDESQNEKSRRSAAPGSHAKVFQELGCPYPGVSQADYFAEADRLGVDAVRLFACNRGRREQRWLTALGEHLGDRKQPWSITAASPFQNPDRPLFFPAISLDLPKRKKPSRSTVLGALQRGRFSVSAGAQVRVVDDAPNSARQVGEGDGRPVTVAVRPAFGVKPLHLQIVSEQGRVKRIRLPELDDWTTPLRVRIPRDLEAQWLRFEVFGKSADTALSALFSPDGGSRLGTTQFLPAQSLLPE